MSRPSSWQIWTPRLLFVGMALLGVQFVLGLVVRSAAIRSSEAALGTGVEIGGSRVSLWDQKVTLNDLRIADPHCSANTLLEADRCELEYAARLLLQKQAIVTRGRISGLRFSAFAGGESIAESAAAQSAPAIQWFRDDSAALTSQWLAHLAERFRQNRPDQLESMQRAEAFCETWSARSAALEARGIELNERMVNLQKAVEAARVNPLRGDKVMAELPQTIADLQHEFAQLNADLAKLPNDLEQQRRAIVAARRGDADSLRKHVTLEPIEADALSAYLLRQQAAKPLNELVGWLRWIRRPASDATTTGGRKPRGEDILFAGCRRAPNLLIQALELRGAARIAGQPVELRGLLTGLSSNAALAAEPVRLRLAATGSMPLELQATIDRTRGAQRESLLLDCQGVLWPQIALGRSDELAVTIGPSLGSLSVSLAVDGETLAGEIQIVQRNVRITPTVAGELANVPIAAALGETLGRIDSLATRASVGGTLSEPTCTLWSNLGPAVAEAMERALERARGEHARQTLAEAGQQVDERLTTIERQMSEQQTRWSARFAEVRGQLQTIAAGEAPRGRISPERLGRRLPGSSLFR
jgi:uncharacterized protein (TIGR03545 family)